MEAVLGATSWSRVESTPVGTVFVHSTVMDGDWVLDEPAHAGAEHLDPAFVERYDRKQGHPDPTDDIVALAAGRLPGEATVVDFGAGTGQFTLAAAEVFGRVVAVDVSVPMLEHLEARVNAAGLTNVTCIQAGFLSYEHTGPPADAVFTRNALHQLPDFWKAMALHRIAGLLRPGGVLRIRDLVYDCAPSEVSAVFGDWLSAAVTDPTAGYTRQDLEEHIRTEHSTFRWLFEPMLAAAGFHIDSVEYRRRVYAAYTCTWRA